MYTLPICYHLQLFSFLAFCDLSLIHGENYNLALADIWPLDIYYSASHYKVKQSTLKVLNFAGIKFRDFRGF